MGIAWKTFFFFLHRWCPPGHHEVTTRKGTDCLSATTSCSCLYNWGFEWDPFRQNVPNLIQYMEEGLWMLELNMSFTQTSPTLEPPPSGTPGKSVQCPVQWNQLTTKVKAHSSGPLFNYFPKHVASSLMMQSQNLSLSFGPLLWPTFGVCYRHTVTYTEEHFTWTVQIWEAAPPNSIPPSMSIKVPHGLKRRCHPNCWPLSQGLMSIPTPALVGMLKYERSLTKQS